MLEQVLFEYLNSDGVLSVPAYLERPEDPEDSFVVIERTGGSERDCIKTAVIAIQSIAPTLYEAAVLNEQVFEAMFGAVRLPQIGGVRLNDYYNFTNKEQTGRDEYRYQAIFQITHY